MQAILWPIVTWLLREVIVKFLIFTAMVALIGVLMPMLIGYMVGWNGDSLTSAFRSLSPGLVYFLTVFKVPQGLALVLSALCTRFLIRRLPVIG